MIKKIIYLTLMPLSDKVARDWWFDKLDDSGFEVEYWDLRNIFHESSSENEGQKHPKIKNIHSLKEFELNVRANPGRETIYFVIIPLIYEYLKVYLLLKCNKCRTISVIWWGGGATQFKIYEKLFSALLSPFKYSCRFIKKLSVLLCKKSGLIKKHEVVFTSFEADSAEDFFAEKVVRINHCDHDVNMRASPFLLSDRKEKYAVFLDINLPHQEDIKICGLPRIDASSYYKSLDKFFKYIESEMGVKVVIALHPSSGLASELGFPERMKIKGKTAELVQGAELVLSHHSTAISFAIMNYKPIVFFYTEEMYGAYKENAIESMRQFSYLLGATLVNIDIDQPLKVKGDELDRKKYDDYKNKNLSAPTTECRENHEIVLESLHLM